MKTSPRKFITIFSASVLLSLLTGVLGAPLMRVLRLTYGALAYWLLGISVVALFWLADPTSSIIIGAIWMTLGAYMELERRGLRWSVSALIGVIAGSFFFAASTGLQLMLAGAHNLAQAKTLFMTQFAERLERISPDLKVEAGKLVPLIPGYVVIILVVALGLGLIFERRVFSWVKLPREKMASQLKLLEFRLPDYMIWVAGIAFLLITENFNVKALEVLGMNLKYVMATLYFFQGWAVLEVYFRSFKASALMRTALYIILVGQLPLVSVIGLIDYWVDFRRRLRKWELKSSQNT